MKSVLSVVLPVRHEAPNVALLIAEIRASLAGVDHQIIYVDDGSDNATPKILRAQKEGVWRRHRTGCRQSAAIVTNVRAACGIWVATTDGDWQNDPADIPPVCARAECSGARFGLPGTGCAGTTA